MTQYVEDLFDYDPETGWFTNKTNRGPARAGERAGSLMPHGYRRIVTGGRKYYEHRLAWLYIHGEYPDEIDHINGDRSDNRISNLRLCDRTQNNANARMGGNGIAGLPGVYLDRRTMNLFAKIQFRGRSIYLGACKTAEEGHEIYAAAHRELYGEHSLYNNSKES